MRPPLFILAPPRSFTSIVCSMLGQHPEMYGLAETHLFIEQTMRARSVRGAQATYPVDHGLLRVVAELYFGAQDESAIGAARRWLQAHSASTTADVFRALGRTVFPLILIDKSPSTINSLATLQRLRADFPQARYIHLLRHPRGHGESVMRFIGERKRQGPLPPTHWLLQMSSLRRGGRAPHPAAGTAVLDPQIAWHARNTVICQFLQTLPPSMSLRLRGEDLLSAPDQVLAEIARWLGVRSDFAAIEEMKHPERSPFAFVGPPGARSGNDPSFLRDPVLRPASGRKHSLDGPLSWRDDGEGFLPEVRELAMEFGYT